MPSREQKNGVSCGFASFGTGKVQWSSVMMGSWRKLELQTGAAHFTVHVPDAAHGDFHIRCSI